MGTASDTSRTDVARLLQLLANGTRRIDAWPGDVLCPSLKRVPILGKGYGLITTAAIPKGELLFALKAVDAVYHDEIPSDLLRRFPSAHPCGLAQRALARRLVELLSNAESSHEVFSDNGKAQRIFSLFDGSGDYGFKARGSSGGHTQLHASGLASLEQELRLRVTKQGSKQALCLDEQRLLQIIRLNADETVCFSPPGERSQILGVALFPELAWCNHSFEGNVVGVVICDVVLMRAARDIQQGEELSRCYVPWNWEQDALRHNLAHYGIKLDACLRSFQSFLPSEVAISQGWHLLCQTMARVQELETEAASTAAEREAILLRAQQEHRSILKISEYLQVRVLVLLIHAQSEPERLSAAEKNADLLFKHMRICTAPAGECFQILKVLIRLCVRLCIARMLGSAAHILHSCGDMAEVFLGPAKAAYRVWIRGLVGPESPLEELLVVPAVSQSLLPLELDAMD